MEIKLSELAETKIKDALKDQKEDSNIRIYVMKVACSGAQLGIAIDDLNEKDEMTEVNGIKFITDTEYMPTYTDGINIDFVLEPQEGFLISSLRPISSGCNSGCEGCGH